MKHSSELPQTLPHKIFFEIIWLLLAGLVATLFLIPILTKANDFHFWLINAIFIFSFITITRILFTLKYTFWSRSQYFKLILVFACLPLLFYLINGLNSFLAYLDEYTLTEFLDHLSAEKQTQLSRYIRSEMIFFAVGSIIAALLLPFRLVISIWRQRNRGTV